MDDANIAANDPDPRQQSVLPLFHQNLTHYPEQVLPRGPYFKLLLCGSSIITSCFLSSLAPPSSKKGVMDVLLPTSVVTFIDRICTLEVWYGSKWMTLVIGEWSPPIGVIGLWHRMCSGPLLGKDGPVKWGREQLRLCKWFGVIFKSVCDFWWRKIDWQVGAVTAFMYLGLTAMSLFFSSFACSNFLKFVLKHTALKMYLMWYHKGNWYLT